MSEDLLTALRPLFDRWQTIVHNDPALRRQFADLGRALLAWAEGTVPTAAGPAIDEHLLVAAAPAEGQPEPESAPIPAEPPAPRPEPPLTVGRGAPPPPPAPVPVLPEVHFADLATIEVRCRLKAEAARWVAAGHRATQANGRPPLEHESQLRGLIEQARALPNCFLWMCQWTGPARPEPFDNLGGCFEAASEAAALIRQLGEPPAEPLAGYVPEVLRLAAEAQSALWSAIREVERGTDDDQVKLYIWAREAAAQHELYIDRFLSQRWPAAAANWADLLGRLRALRDQFQQTLDRARRRKKLFGNLRYKLGQLAQRSPAEQTEEWPRIVELVDTLVQDGLPPSNVELRELLLPVIEVVPEEAELPKPFRLVLREIDRYLASRPQEESPADDEPIPELRRAAELLRGRAVVLIGGDRRPYQEAALVRGLGLCELHWVEASGHGSITVFEPYVARGEVALVLLAIRWSSHSFGEVKGYCDKYGKPLVYLPRGYNVNQVAFEIVRQVSQRLAVG